MLINDSKGKRPYSRSSVVRLIGSRESLAERGDASPAVVEAIDQVMQDYTVQVGGLRKYIVEMLGSSDRGGNLADLPPELCRAVFADGREIMGSSRYDATIVDWLLSLDDLPKFVCIARPPDGEAKRYLS